MLEEKVEHLQGPLSTSCRCKSAVSDKLRKESTPSSSGPPRFESPDSEIETDDQDCSMRDMNNPKRPVMAAIDPSAQIERPMSGSGVNDVTFSDVTVSSSNRGQTRDTTRAYLRKPYTTFPGRRTLWKTMFLELPFVPKKAPLRPEQRFQHRTIRGSRIRSWALPGCIQTKAIGVQTCLAVT